MLLVKTYLDKSPINGTGLFAAQDIPAGTVIWRFTEVFDLRYSKHVVDRWPESDEKSFLLKYAYLDGWSYVLCIDDARFMNHSATHNTGNGDGEETIAIKNISVGEEITCNYFEIDDAAKEKFQICNDAFCSLSSNVGQKIQSCKENGCPYKKN